MSIVSRRRRSSRLSMMLDQLEQRRMMYNPGDPDPILSDDNEPNNSFAAATNLGVGNSGGVQGQTITGAGTKYDVDYFQITAATSATMQVRIDFQHVDANLNLKLYNGSQTLLATSDSSSNLQNYELITFNAQAGQSYYFRVTGTSASPDYSLSYNALSADFGWSMPKTFGNQLDPFGLPEIPNTSDYAVPDPVTIDGVQTARFPVKFTVPTGLSGADYTYVINGAKYSTTSSGTSTSRDVDLPEGTYTVTCNATANGATASTTQTITVRNYLIVAIGDSYGSGEGNPHSPAQYDWAGFATRGAIWADSPDATEALYNRMSHRSSKAGAAQAALALENASDKTSVTFVFLNASGATISAGALGPQDSAEPDAAPGQVPGQLAHLRQIVGYRPIDTMVMSLGGNDMGFATVLRDLVTNANVPPFTNYEQGITDILQAAEDRVQTLGSTGYPALANALKQFSIRNTILTEYPDISRDSTGGYATNIIGDVVSGLSVDQHEIERAMTELMPQLVTTMITACRKFGWTYGDGVAAQYHNHGYGDWLRTATDSTIQEGPLGNVNLLTALDKQNTWGTMHPIGGGLDALRDVLTGKFYAPNLAMSDFSVSGNALIDGNATWSLKVTNTSMLGTAPASVAALYMSPDTSVTTADTLLTTLNVPELAPGQSITISGTIPTHSDPYHTATNAVFLAPVLDFANVVAEANEGDNNAYTPAMIASVKSDLDVGSDFVGNPIALGQSIAPGQTIAGDLGLTEAIGGADVDFYRINLNAGQTIGVDLDAGNGLDTYVSIFDTYNGVLVAPALAGNDNGAAPGETNTAGDSYLRYTATWSGSYIIAVSHAANANLTNPLQLPARNVGQTGTYSISVNTITAAPPPSVVSSSYDVDARTIRFQFNTDAHFGLSATSLTLQSSTGQTVSSDKYTYSYDAATNTARFTLNAAIPDGDWTATLRGADIRNSDGIVGTNTTRSFFILAGDANHDRKVDFSDLLILARNYGQTGKVFSAGNVDYSADGKVDFNDLLILARQYGKALPVAQAPLAASQSLVASERRRSTFSGVEI